MIHVGSCNQCMVFSDVNAPSEPHVKTITLATTSMANVGITIFTIIFGFSCIRHNNELDKCDTNRNGTLAKFSNSSYMRVLSKICCIKKRPHETKEKKKISFVVREPSTIIWDRHSIKNAINVTVVNNVKIAVNKHPHIKQDHDPRWNCSPGCDPSMQLYWKALVSEI